MATHETNPNDHDAIDELLNPYHHRASTPDGNGHLVIEPGQILANITLAMERLDNDINTPISIEDDVISTDELLAMTQQLNMGPAMTAHVANTALRIMSARYPSELVYNPLPPEYDLRRMIPLDVSNHQHDTAKNIFNRRTTNGTTDLHDNDLTELASVNTEEHLCIFVALFYMYGNKLGALKHQTGTP